ncbi:MAG: ABC transporter ATP-binding protein/permease [Lachnospiraceae bacterium]|nr:ABC transporter ATP-binding protein/permease [Lachnospiraceae bacterium]
MNRKIREIRTLIKEYYRADSGGFLILFLMTTIIGCIPYIYVKVYSAFVDGIVEVIKGNMSVSSLKICATAVIGIYVFQFAYETMERIVRIGSTIKVNKSIYNRIVFKYARIEYKDIETARLQKLLYNVLAGVKTKIVDGTVTILSLAAQMLGIVSVIIVIAQNSLAVALIVLLCFIPIVIVSALRGSFDNEAFKKTMEIERRKESYEKMLIKETYANERRIYAFSDWIIEKWDKKANEFIDILCSSRRKSFVKIKISSTLMTMVLWGVIGAMIFLYMRRMITIGMCMILIAKIISINEKLSWGLASKIYNITNAAAYMETYEEYFSFPERKRELGNVKIGKVESIEFKNLKFRYTDETPYILNGINLKLDCNNNYAVVGQNGAGKSTLMKLLSGIYDDYEGEILINGVELREIANNPFAVVFQDYAKYEMSVRENVLLLIPYTNESKNKMEEALRILKLNLDKSIYGNEYEKELGRLTEDNREPSGGMWQKLAMVRAFVQDRSYYILDEPTAALDPIVENEVYRNFAKLMNGCHGLIITHRLGAARLADCILVIKDGKIIEVGNHDELVRKGGEYAMMFETQKGWYSENAV